MFIAFAVAFLVNALKSALCLDQGWECPGSAYIQDQRGPGFECCLCSQWQVGAEGHGG